MARNFSKGFSRGFQRVLGSKAGAGKREAVSQTPKRTIKSRKDRE